MVSQKSIQDSHKQHDFLKHVSVDGGREGWGKTDMSGRVVRFFFLYSSISS